MNFNIDIAQFSMASVVVIPIILAIIQAIKMTGWLPDRFAPFASIGVGVAIAFVAAHDSPDLSATILNGVLFGLSASGLYSGVKTTMDAQAKVKEKTH